MADPVERGNPEVASVFIHGDAHYGAVRQAVSSAVNLCHLAVFNQYQTVFRAGPDTLTVNRDAEDLCIRHAIRRGEVFPARDQVWALCRERDRASQKAKRKSQKAKVKEAGDIFASIPTGHNDLPISLLQVT